MKEGIDVLPAVTKEMMEIGEELGVEFVLEK